VRIPRSADRKRRLAVLRQIASADNCGTEGIPVAASADQATRQFTSACGARLPLRLSIRNERTGASEDVLLERSWAVIGGDDRCDIRLAHPDISQRHAYLQVIDSRILCCDLGSRTGTHASREVRARSWMTTGEHVYVGPYSIQLSDNEFVPGGNLEPSESPAGALSDDRPAAFLSFVNARNRSGQKKVSRIGHKVTLIGGSASSNVRLQHSSVGRVHCSLVWTAAGLWVVDLLCTGGTLVNGLPVDVAHLEEGDAITIGRFELQFSYVEPQEYSADLRDEEVPGKSISVALPVSESVPAERRPTFDQSPNSPAEVVASFHEPYERKPEGISSELVRFQEISREMQTLVGDLLRFCDRPVPAQMTARLQELEQERSLLWREMMQYLAPGDGGDAV
jgi:pSer/pThr/pTyr-binding forkhead associated (FHA) protein